MVRIKHTYIAVYPFFFLFYLNFIFHRPYNILLLFKEVKCYMYKISYMCVVYVLRIVIYKCIHYVYKEIIARLCTLCTYII